MVFTFSLIVIMIWSISSGVVKAEGLLMLGLFQLACLPGYLVGSKTFFERGDSLLGNVFLIFATSFGGISGLGNIAVVVTGYLGLAVDNTIYNFPLLWAGMVLIACAICFRKAEAFALGGGHSAIFSPKGARLTESLSPDKEGILYADIDLSNIIECKYFIDCGGHYSKGNIASLLYRQSPQPAVQFIGEQPSVFTSFSDLSALEKEER